MGIAHHTTNMALRLRRDLIDAIGQLFAVAAGRADVVGLIGVQFCSLRRLFIQRILRISRKL
jgi:hypothetical protein